MPQSKRRAALATNPEATRLAKAKGGKPRVDRQGGAYGQGLITGVSVATVGEALGHGVWLDKTAMQQIVELGNAQKPGLKSRFTHPDMSSDGLGKLTSRLRDFELSKDGEQALASQHFLAIGHTAPDGDLAGYQMDLAEEDPEAYGLSIVFYRDQGEMDRFRAEHTDADGKFKSPDERNANNYPHVRLRKLTAADAVDEPAANPAGLFRRKDSIADQASALAAYAFGLSDEIPQVDALGMDAERVRAFATRFLTNRNLELRPMSTVPAPAVDPAKPAETSLSSNPAETPVVVNVTTGDKFADARAEMTRFKNAFGDAGLAAFAAGKSFEEAAAEFSKTSDQSLADRLTALENQLKAGGKVNGEGAPVGFQAGDKTDEKKGFATRIRFSGAAPAETATK